MGNSSAFGSLARKAIAFVVIAFVAIFLFKMAFAIIAGAFQLLMAIAFLALIGYLVIWALRKL